MHEKRRKTKMLFTDIANWFMSLDYTIIIACVSIFATLLTTLIYKWVTDQKKLKESKVEMKKLQQEQKKYKDNPKKLMQVQQQMLEINMVMMKQSFKPMIYTFLPLILLFYFMSSSFAYYPLHANEPFTMTALISESFPDSLDAVNLTSIPATTIIRNVTYAPSDKNTKGIQWIVTAPSEGNYSFLIESKTFKQTKDIVVTSEKKYASVMTDYKDSQLQKLVIGNKEVTTFIGINWIWTYILLSVISSLIIRKILNVA